MEYAYVKALHIIFVITWFSGLFYLGRLFIYNQESIHKEYPDKNILVKHFTLMMKRLFYAITWPSAVLTWFFGIWLVIMYPGWPIWLIVKIGLVILLSLYHISLDKIYRNQSSGKFAFTSFQLRIWNEVPTVFLIAIVMLVVVKQNISIAYGLGGLLIFILVLFSAMKIYKSLREKP
jgi:putative membrane protein